MKRSPLRRRSRLGSKQKIAIEKNYGQARAQVFCRAEGRCELCGSPLSLSGMNAHHRLPRSAGRDDSPANLLCCCAKCHQWVHEHPLLSVAAGASITRCRVSAPRDVAVRLVGGWFLLTDSGDRVALPGPPETPMVA